MKELLKENKNEPQKIPAVFIMVEHTPENAVKNATLLGQCLEEQLQKYSQGTVLAVIEDTYRPLAVANYIHWTVSDDLQPSLGYAFACHIEDQGKMVESMEELSAYREKLLKEADLHYREQLQILDQLFLRYRGRLGVLWEGTPEENLAEEFKNDSGHKIRAKEALQLVDRGNFDEALLLFKKAIISPRDSSEARERRITERILEATKSNNIAGVVGSFGAVHTPIVHSLRSLGFVTTMFFPAKPERQAYIYDPSSIITRALRFFPEREIAELIWFKIMIGDYLYALLMSKDGSQNVNVKRFVYETLSRLPNLESIRNFQGKVQEKGFIKACLDL